VSVELKMPRWGMAMKEGTLSKWHKSEGDHVAEGELLFEVETEKITNTVESIASGVLFQIVVHEGETVSVGTVVGIIAAEGETPERIKGIKISPIDDAETAAEREAVTGQAGAVTQKRYVSASPIAKRLAKEFGIDLTQVKGTGHDGRVTESDVEEYHNRIVRKTKITPVAKEMATQAGIDISAITGTGTRGKITKEDVMRIIEQGVEAASREGEAEMVKSIPYKGIRKTIGDNMYASLQHTAQLTAFTETDVTEMVRLRDLLREEYKDDEAFRISYNDIIMLATARALKRHPIMNSTLVGEEILIHDTVNLGIAVALPDGLIVPKIRNADKKSLLKIAVEARELARKARQGNLSIDEVTDGTFTISNVSMLGMDGFTPVLNPPETGILGVGRVIEKPSVYRGEIAIRSMMVLSLTFDHRVVDGEPAMRFLQTLARYLEQPLLIKDWA